MTRRTVLCAGLAAFGAAVHNLNAAAIEIGSDRAIAPADTIQSEPCIAAHPSKSGSLILSHTEIRAGQVQPKLWFSADAGDTWVASRFDPLLDSTLSANHWVTYAGDGQAYCAATRHSAAAAPLFIDVYRSDDEGRRWNPPVTVPGTNYDQPRIVADGRVLYIAATQGGIAVVRSRDRGASFEIASRTVPSNLGNQPREPLILADGSLLIPYADFPLRTDQQFSSSRIYAMRSEDAGSTFERPSFIADMPRAFPGGGVAFAVDLSTGGSFRGRIYALWEGGDFGPRVISVPPNFQRVENGIRRELQIAWSNDNGRTWSPPKQVTPPSPGPQFMGTLAVAPNGTVGAIWIQHEKYETNPRDYRAWFAASTDGGETFAPPQPISSAVSRPNRTELETVPYVKTRPRGGDYIALAAASDSTFHAAWADARDGLYRIRHAPIRVIA